MKITFFNEAVCRSIYCTVVLPAWLTFCIKINRLPTGNSPENMVIFSIHCDTIGVVGVYIHISQIGFFLPCILYLQCVTLTIKYFYCAINCSPMIVIANFLFKGSRKDSSNNFITGIFESVS